LDGYADGEAKNERGDAASHLVGYPRMCFSSALHSLESTADADAAEAFARREISEFAGACSRSIWAASGGGSRYRRGEQGVHLAVLAARHLVIGLRMAGYGNSAWIPLSAGSETPCRSLGSAASNPEQESEAAFFERHFFSGFSRLFASGCNRAGETAWTVDEYRNGSHPAP
jgi:hypothetical protein